MRHKLFLAFFLISVCTLGQTNIRYVACTDLSRFKNPIIIDKFQRIDTFAVDIERYTGKLRDTEQNAIVSLFASYNSSNDTIVKPLSYDIALGAKDGGRRTVYVSCHKILLLNVLIVREYTGTTYRHYQLAVPEWVYHSASVNE